MHSYGLNAIIFQFICERTPENFRVMPCSPEKMLRPEALKVVGPQAYHLDKLIKMLHPVNIGFFGDHNNERKLTNEIADAVSAVTDILKPNYSQIETVLSNP